MVDGKVVLKNECQRDVICYNNIQLCVQYALVIVDWIVINTIEKTHVITWNSKRKRIFILTSNDFCISIWTRNFKRQLKWFTITNWMIIPIQSEWSLPSVESEAPTIGPSTLTTKLPSTEHLESLLNECLNYINLLSSIN